MNITVRKPTEDEKSVMLSKPIWTCEVSEFDWGYDSEETCLILEGQVTVEYDGGSASFGPGDYVIFPRGLSCVWKVAAPVKKHYVFK
ncbi:MAG: cupin domain-containing protein [Chitinispirillia bacterium]|nr:cupin domain-containing protein [Chitinispirillia bacterium]MCL2269337.1 cupin domain-containing protein [Chitinispirillia bacterium]